MTGTSRRPPARGQRASAFARLFEAVREGVFIGSLEPTTAGSRDSTIAANPHLKSMFGQYVSDVVVDKLIAEGQRPNLSGEKLDVSVLFSDIRNFTTISEKLDAEEVVEMLNAYFTLTCEPILEQV